MPREVDRFAGPLKHVTLTTMELPPEDLDDLKLLTINSVMRMLDMSRMDVYRRMYAGDIQSVKIGKMVRIPLSSLRTYVQRLKDEAAA